MDQMESEDGEAKDVKVDTADPKIPPPCTPSSPALSEKLQDLDVNIFVTGASVGSTVSRLLPGSAEPPGGRASEEAKPGLEITDAQPADDLSRGDDLPETPAPRDDSDVAKGSGSEKVEGVSEVNAAAAAEVKRAESEPLNKPESDAEQVASQGEAPIRVPIKTPAKAEPENMNVLTLEKEVHNQYFQAPLLGQSLALKAQTGKDLPLMPLCLRRTGESNPDIAATGEEDPDKSPLPADGAIPANEPEGEDTDADISELSEPKKDKPGELLCGRPGSDSPVRQVLLSALQSAASRGSLSLSSHCKQSSDTADSDDSPSALEMEDIPTGITCVSSEDHGRPGTLMSLAAPPLSRIRMRLLDGPASERVPAERADNGASTSPEGTDAGLSEDEEDEEEEGPQMESLPTRQAAVEEASAVCPEGSGDGPLSSGGESAYTVSCDDDDNSNNNNTTHAVLSVE